MKGGFHLPNKFRRVPIGEHIKPTAPQLKTKLFGKTYRPITAANISSPINIQVIPKNSRQITLTNGYKLKESTSHLPVNREVYNGQSHYLGDPPTQIVTFNEEV